MLMADDKCQIPTLTICTGRLKRDKSFWKWLLGRQLIGYPRCSPKRFDRQVVTPGIEYDIDHLCPQECVPQPAPQHFDRPEHRLFSALAYPHDGDLEKFLSSEGHRGIGAASGNQTQSLTGL